MYETYFGLRRRPFRASPDLDGYYPATAHESILSRLIQTMREDEGWAILTGDVGTGKTLLCHCLVERLGATVQTAFLTNSHFDSRAALFQAILYDFNQPYQGLGEQELRLALTDYLLKSYGEGRRTALIIDEAHHLSPDLLEELRLLGNLEARKGKALQMILVGQSALLQTLRLPELVCLSQRVAIRLKLEPLGVEESADYLLHQLRIAGGKPESLLGDEAREVLAVGTHGIPRLLNQAAHQALVLAFEGEAESVDAEAALEALAMVGLDAELEGPDSSAEIGSSLLTSDHEDSLSILAARPEHGISSQSMHSPRPA